MSNMSHWLRKGLAIIATLATSASLTLVGVSSAQADQTGPWTIRSTSSGAVAQGYQDWFQYYASGVGYKIEHVTVGTSTVQSFHVTDGLGDPAVGQTVTLILGKAYSGSNAQVSVGSTAANLSAGLTNDQATVTGTTDSNGDVSFTINNSDTATVSPKLFTQIAAFVSGAGVDVIDIVDIVYDDAPAPTPTATPSASESASASASASESASSSASASSTGVTVPANVKITLSSTDLQGPAGAYGNAWWNDNAPANNYVKYIVAGQTFSVSYLVKDAATDTAVGAGVPVTISVDKKGTPTADFTGSLSATTDASGIATFTLTSTDTDATAESYRADLTTWSDAVGTEYKADFTPAVTGATATVADLLWTHTVRSAAPEVPQTVATIRLTSANTAAMTNKSYWYTDTAANVSWVKFLTAGDVLTLNYVVTKDGAAVAGKTVTLSAANAGAGANFTGDLTGTTDSNGAVTFTLTNTDSSGEPRPTAPSTMSYWDDSRVVSPVYEKDFTPSLESGVADVVNYDRVWVHVVNQEASASPSASASESASASASASESASATPTVAADTPFALTFETDDTNGVVVPFEGAGGSIADSVAPYGDKAAKIIRTGQIWSGATILDGSATLTSATNPVVTLDFYNPLSTSVPVMIKLEKGVWPDTVGVEFSQDAASGWSTLTYDFSTKSGWSGSTGYTRLAVFPNFLQASGGESFYVDNVALNGATQTESTLAPSPTASASESASATPSATPTSTDASCVAVADAASGAKTVRIQGLSDANSLNKSGDAAYFVSQGWYAAGLGFREHRVTVGSTNTFTYQVTDSAGACVSGATVNFIFNKHWSGSSATFNLDGVTVEGPQTEWGDGTEYHLTGTTDANGSVSFTIANTNTAGQGADYNADKSVVYTGTHLFSQITAYAGSIATDVIDLTDIVFENPAPSASPSASASASESATPSSTGVTVPANVKITLSSTDLQGPAGAYGNGWWNDNAPANNYVKYIVAGQTFSVSYLVKDAATDTAVGAGVPVTLSVAKPKTGQPTFSEASWSATTNSSGIATFSITNTDTDATAESYRADLTTWSDAVGTEYGADFTPAVTGATATVADLLWTHVTAANAPEVPDTIARIYLTDADRATMSNKSYWWTDNAASYSRVKFLKAGATLTLNYVVTYEDGTPIVGETVTLAAENGSYDLAASFTGSLTGTTDSNGAVTFTLTNTNTDAQAEPYPTAPSSMIWWDDSRGASLTSQTGKNFIPSISTATANIQRIDRVWTHVVQNNAGTPTNVTATRAWSGATVNWTAPTSGPEVTGYTITYSDGTTDNTVTAAAGATSKTLTGLTNNTTYTVTVVANSAQGDSDASTAVTVKPSLLSARVPGVVTASAVAGHHSLTVTYAAGADNGSTITRIEYSTDGGSTWTETTSSPISLTGLPNGVLKSVKIRAVNSLGNGPAVTRSGRPTFLANAITFTQPSAMTYGDADQALSISEDGGTTVVTSLTPTVCTLVSGAAHIVKTGTCRIKATNAGNDDYKAATTVYRSFVIARAAQTITPSGVSAGANTLEFGLHSISATAESGLPVTITASPRTVCTYSAMTGKLYVMSTSSTCTVTMRRGLSTNYLAATTVVATVN